MKKLCWFVVGAAAVAGCAGKMPEPRTPTMVRSFRGTIVPGYYVSPVSYEHYIRAQLLSNDGRAEEASDELRQAIASDGASPYLRTRLAEELLTLGARRRGARRNRSGAASRHAVRRSPRGPGARQAAPG